MPNAFWIVESTNRRLVAIERPTRPAGAVCQRPFPSIDQAEHHIGLLEEEREWLDTEWYAPSHDEDAAEAAALSEANHPLRRLAAAAHAGR